MSNPNNLIQPPRLVPGSSTQSTSEPIQQTNGQPVQGISIPQMTAMISGIVQQVIETQFKGLIQANANLNQNFANYSDQTIDPSQANNISELDRIPDVVRCLREFSGNPGEFSSWKKSVDRILQIYEPIAGTPKYYGILNLIRNKIVGNADVALETYNTPLNWKAISKCLMLHYADKRDIRTLEYQMTSLVQGNQTVQEFYQQVYAHLSLILNKIGCMDLTTEPLQLFTQSYRDKALDTFVRGLRGDLPRLLGMKEPMDLPQALHLCLKLENQDFRANYAHNTHGVSGRFSKPPPPVPRRNVKQPNFYPQLAHLPQPAPNVYRRNDYPVGQSGNMFNSMGNSFQTRYVPPRPSIAKPQARPEPMDVDVSMRSNRINYMNRPKPNDLYGKRPPPSSLQAHRNKVQRNYHMDVNYDLEGHCNDDPQPTDSEFLNEQKYFQNAPAEVVQQDEHTEDFNDLHFLG